MKYFITYHNEEKMGPYEKELVLYILTSKPVNQIVGSYVFLVIGKGNTPKSYELGAAFKATKILTASEPSYLYRVEGEGIYIEKYSSLNGFAWFDKLKEITQNFRFGTSEIFDTEIIEGFRGMAARNGLHVS